MSNITTELQNNLRILKVNEEKVGKDVLMEKYKNAYIKLKKDIKDGALDFILDIVSLRNVPPEKTEQAITQISVIIKRNRMGLQRTLYVEKDFEAFEEVAFDIYDQVMEYIRSIAIPLEVKFYVDGEGRKIAAESLADIS